MKSPPNMGLPWDPAKNPRQLGVSAKAMEERARGTPAKSSATPFAQCLGSQGGTSRVWCCKKPVEVRVTRLPPQKPTNICWKMMGLEDYFALKRWHVNFRGVGLAPIVW